MKTMKCQQCGLISMSAANCKQCGARQSTPGSKAQNQLVRKIVGYVLLAAIAFGLYWFTLRPANLEAKAAQKTEAEQIARTPKTDDLKQVLELQMGTAGESPAGSGRGYGRCHGVISYDYSVVGPGNEVTYEYKGQSTRVFEARATFTKSVTYPGGLQQVERYNDVSFAVAKNAQGLWEMVDSGSFGVVQANHLYRRTQQEELEMRAAARAATEESGNTSQSEYPCK